MNKRIIRYKLITFIFTLVLVLALYLPLLIPLSIKNNLDMIGGLEIALLILYGLVCLLLPPSFIYYFYGVLYVEHKYRIFDDPLDIFRIVFLSPKYAVNFYFTKIWYIKRDEYRNSKDTVM